MSQLPKYSGRIGVCILLFVLYFYAWRPVRMAVTQKMVYPVLNKVESDRYELKNDGVALRLSFSWRGESKTTQYRPSAGFFFLIGLLSLVLTGAAWKPYSLLIGFHLFMTLVTVFIIIASKTGSFTGFVLVDLFVTYLIPAFTLAYVGWTISKKRKKTGYELNG